MPRCARVPRRMLGSSAVGSRGELWASAPGGSDFTELLGDDSDLPF